MLLLKSPQHLVLVFCGNEQKHHTTGLARTLEAKIARPVYVGDDVLEGAPPLSGAAVAVAGGRGSNACIIIIIMRCARAAEVRVLLRSI